LRESSAECWVQEMRTFGAGSSCSLHLCSDGLTEASVVVGEAVASDERQRGEDHGAGNGEGEVMTDHHAGEAAEKRCENAGDSGACWHRGKADGASGGVNPAEHLGWRESLSCGEHVDVPGGEPKWAGVSGVLADTCRGRLHDPGRVFTDLAAAVADGANCVSGIGRLSDQCAQHGPVASVSTAWRLLGYRIDAAHLLGVKAARAAARANAWAAGAAPPAGTTLTIDIDATITIDHSDNKGERRRDLETHLRLSPAAGFPGPARHFRRRRWPGCCDRVTPVPTPPPTMSPC
jgi:hypothetical protein